MKRLCAGLLVNFLFAAILLVPAKPSPGEKVPVYAVSGQGADRIEPGKTVTVQGVVTADYLHECGLDGFFIQGKEPAPDDLPSGLFIYSPHLKKHTQKAIRKGRLVRIKGRSGVFRGRPQLEQVTSISLRGTAETRALRVKMPLSRPERLEGVKVSFGHAFTVTDNYDLKKYGSLELAKGGRAFRPTNFPPGVGPPDPARKDKRIIMDDGCYSRNPHPVPYLNPNGTLRVGTTVKKGLTGILTHAFQAWRIHPTEDPGFANTNPRPGPLPQTGQNSLRVAVINTHSYFLTLGKRGANNKKELNLQQDKLLAGIKNLRPDILVLLEMENRDKVPEHFIRNLRRASKNPWELIQTKNVSKNNIRISLAYRRDRIKQSGSVKRDFASVHDRPPIISGFKPRGKGKSFALAAVHFKSKSNCPQEKDIDSTQGCWNERRKKQSRRLLEFIRKWRNKNSDMPVLVAGDLNAYGAEEPVEILKDSGYTDLLAKRIHWRERYTYIYSGESGYLDHLLASAQLGQRISRVFTHPINADEPRFLGYDNSAAKRKLQDTSQYRSSDHDPVAVDLQLR